MCFCFNIQYKQPDSPALSIKEFNFFVKFIAIYVASSKA